MLKSLRALLRRPRRLGRVDVARLVLGTWLAVHAVVVAGVPVADALAGHGRPMVAHWEDAQDTSCPPQHDPETCQLCQQLTTALVVASTEPDAPAAVVRQGTRFPGDPGTARCDDGLRGFAVSRGPPAA